MQYSAIPVAQRTLPEASAQRGFGAMNSGVPGGPNLYDGGAASKPQVNSQPFANARLQEQSQQQNIQTAKPQASADAIQKVSNLANVESNSTSAAQQFADTRKSEVIYAMQAQQSGDFGRGSAMALLGASDFDNAAFERNIASNKALGMGLSPDLGDAAGSARMYG